MDEDDDDASVIDLTGSEDEPEIEGEMTYYPEVKRELQDSGVSQQDPGDSGVPPKDVGLRRSSRTRTQATIFSPKMTGQSHDEGVREGVGFPETAANSLAAAQEESSILPPDVYDTVRGVLNLETDKGEPIFSEMSKRKLRNTCHGSPIGPALQHEES